MTIVSLLALLAASVAMLGQLGRWSDVVDAINIFLPYLLVPALGAAALVLLVERHRRGLAFRSAAVALLLGVAGPLPLLLGAWHDGGATTCGKEGAAARLRIVQFNLWKDNRTTASAARWIRLVDPYMVLVEEARNAVPVPELLRHTYPYQQSCIGPSLCSTLILAKRPPLASGGLAKADPENRGALSAAWMRVATPAGPFTAVAVHLGRPWPFPRFQGDRAALASFVAAQPAGSTLVAGDFNLPGWTFQLRRLEAAMGLMRRSRVLPSWPTRAGDHPSPVPLLPIDQVFAGRDWAVTDIRRGPFLGSDHYPLVIDLALCR